MAWWDSVKSYFDGGVGQGSTAAGSGGVSVNGRMPGAGAGGASQGGDTKTQPNAQQSNAGKGYEALSRALDTLAKDAQRTHVTASYRDGWGSTKDQSRIAETQQPTKDQSRIPDGYNSQNGGAGGIPMNYSNGPQYTPGVTSQTNNSGAGYEALNNAYGNQRHQDAVNKYRALSSGMGAEAMNGLLSNNMASPEPVGDYAGDNIADTQDPNTQDGASIYDDNLSGPKDPIHDYITKKAFNYSQKIGDPLHMMAGLLGASGQVGNIGQGSALLALGDKKNGGKEGTIDPKTGKPKKPKPKSQIADTSPLDFPKWKFPTYNEIPASLLPKPYP